MADNTSVVYPKLNDAWNVYYHLQNDKCWDLSSYKLIMTLQHVYDVIFINSRIPDEIIKHCILFVMRKGITPTWEDLKNRSGGAFSFKVYNKNVPSVWKELCYLLCGETLINDDEIYKSVNGISISPKKSFCIIKIWMSGCLNQDPKIITPVNLLSINGCLFKTHEPEY
jgi:hypothetical protein